ncbi:CRM-domain containing factor CFM2, chloroplastic isoform X2 [Macadamia integrifolia]|uniref:CRM-domain containing factor CFM2, chloroplastic isoform X2 n=1 Tax=Macadamia integrifolia TaxID=60698 RepID=UPI001C4F262A|nr:CRM-domain containing factor CFM2, chloroplastic isoform X2 [Macadamia integrifolia]
MLLPLYHQHSSFSLRTLDSQPLFFPSQSSRTLFFRNTKTPQWIIRNSTVDADTISKSAIQRIAEKLRSLGYLEEDNSREIEQPNTGHGSAGEIFIPSTHQLSKYRVGHTLDSSWSTPENPVPEPGSGVAISRFHELKSEVRKQKKSATKEERAPTLAELTIPGQELRRLRTLGIALKKKLKVGKAGITEGIVNGIHERWRQSELVKIKCEDICKMNMMRTHEILERKTGGMVIWRSGSTVILYRGADYEYPYFLSDTNSTSETPQNKVSPKSRLNSDDGGKATPPAPFTGISPSPLVRGVGSPDKVRFQLPGEMELAEDADRLLDGLGPRFTDWWGCDPMPVDADLLPAIVPAHRRPFRLLPYGIKPILTNDEMTILRRLSRPLPCHFALGRNRNLQGLAESMVKLWEKCEIAKIAVKRGVQNTNSELMAEELKRLTGGMLLSRDREYIVFYRGKDFLPVGVSSALNERRKHRIYKENMDISSSIGTMPEPVEKTKESLSVDGIEETNVKREREVLSKERKARSTKSSIEVISNNLSVALEKKAKAEKLLEELEKAAEHQEPELDKEGISEEERYMLRKVGLKMKPFLLLGRRGVFDGTIENMHLHWKYRELVKVISNDRSMEDARAVARTLEAESGGILVAVERVSKGYAIIVYRGKNYERPVELRPRTLLNKREAMKRSLEAQRRESLKLHVLKLSRNIDQLKLKLPKEERGADSTLMHMNDLMDAPSNSIDESKVESSSEAVAIDGTLSRTSLTEVVDRANTEPLLYTEPTSCSENSQSQGMMTYSANDNISIHSSDNEMKKSSVECARNNIRLSVQRGEEKRDGEGFFRAAPLSNKDRLLLRKQALKMKRRPVLAVGRNNVITGVAKTIRTHFRKNRLAIVNIKGRAKGTSIQEVVFKLEQATGAVLVSQEPSKVILYRGWDDGEEPGGDKRSSSTTSPCKERTTEVVPPQLMAAIRLECGLQSNQEGEYADVQP